jgi:hypothetical protein
MMIFASIATQVSDVEEWTKQDPKCIQKTIGNKEHSKGIKWQPQ